jgi:hypothetical protein
MILAATGLPILTGIGVVGEEYFPSGEFKLYEGYECAKQLSP